VIWKILVDIETCFWQSSIHHVTSNSNIWNATKNKLIKLQHKKTTSLLCFAVYSCSTTWCLHRCSLDPLTICTVFTRGHLPRSHHCWRHWPRPLLPVGQVAADLGRPVIWSATCRQFPVSDGIIIKLRNSIRYRYLMVVTSLELHWLFSGHSFDRHAAKLIKDD